MISGYLILPALIMPASHWLPIDIWGYIHISLCKIGRLCFPVFTSIRRSFRPYLYVRHHKHRGSTFSCAPIWIVPYRYRGEIEIFRPSVDHHRNQPIVTRMSIRTQPPNQTSSSGFHTIISCLPCDGIRDIDNDIIEEKKILFCSVLCSSSLAFIHIHRSTDPYVQTTV
jgi:hypothetical protein